MECRFVYVSSLLENNIGPENRLVKFLKPRKIGSWLLPKVKIEKKKKTI